MALLLPFYLLKIREELKKNEKDPVKRKELSERLKCYVSEICEVLQKSQENFYITNKDAVMLQERMSNIHSKLYGRYKEFRESNMTLKQMYNKSVLKKIDDAEARAEARAEAKAEAKVAKAEAQAEKRGLTQGMAQGISQVAKAMKAAGDTVSKIMSCTGLSRREISAL